MGKVRDGVGKERVTEMTCAHGEFDSRERCGELSD